MQVYKIYRIIELKKVCVLTVNSFCNLGIHQIIEIFLVFYNAYIVPRDEKMIMFYINNYIDQNYFNQ